MTSAASAEELEHLRNENRLLRQRLEGLEARSDKAEKARKRLLAGGFRVFVPLLDRQQVVRNFAALAETVSGYSGPPSSWPSRDEVLAATRGFLESIVRFLIRRRLFLVLFSVMATLIPAIQIWLVFQQNEIIQNQTKFAEVQVFDVVSRSMTEGDRNARIMTGALLAHADLPFLTSVMEEAFDKNAVTLYRREGLDASARRAKDTAFRGNLIRAAVRVVEKDARGGRSNRELLAAVQPMYRKVLADSEYRLAEVIRTGRGETGLPGELLEDVDMYIAQVGQLLKVYGRLARSTNADQRYYADIFPLLSRMSKLKSVEESTFASTYRIVMQDFLFEVADEVSLDSGPFQMGKREPETILGEGIGRLKKIYGGGALDWEQFHHQVMN